MTILILLVGLVSLAMVVWCIGLVRRDGLGTLEPPRSHRHEVARHQYDAITEVLS